MLLTRPEAYAYVKDQLDSSGHILSRFLKEKHIEQGTIEALVPDSTPEERLYKFREGGIYPDPDLQAKKESGQNVFPIINNAKALIPGFIRDYLQQSPENCCIIEEPQASPSDPWVVNDKVGYVRLNQEMYYFFNLANFNEEIFARRFSNGVSWYLMCALSRLPQEEHARFCAFSEISENLLKTLAANTVAFLNTAYDFEGFLFWKEQ